MLTLSSLSLSLSLSLCSRRKTSQRGELGASAAVGHVQRAQREAPAAGEPLEQAPGHPVRYLSHRVLHQRQPDGQDAHPAPDWRKGKETGTPGLYHWPRAALIARKSEVTLCGCEDRDGAENGAGCRPRSNEVPPAPVCRVHLLRPLTI